MYVVHIKHYKVIKSVSSDVCYGLCPSLCPLQTCQAVCIPFCAGLPLFHSWDQVWWTNVGSWCTTCKQYSVAFKVYRLVFNSHHIFLPDDQDFLHRLLCVLVLFHKLLYSLPDYRSSDCQLSSEFHSRYKSPVQKLSVQATLNNLWKPQFQKLIHLFLGSFIYVSSRSEHIHPW